MSRRDFAVGLAVGGATGLLADSLGLHSALSYWGPKAPVVAALALAFALLWPTRLRPGLAVVAAGLGALWLAVAVTPLTAWMAQGLVRRDVLRPADAVWSWPGSAGRRRAHFASMSRLLHGWSSSQEQAHVTTEIAPVPSYAGPRSFAGAARGPSSLVGPVHNARRAVLVKRLFAGRLTAWSW
jgi:hypothetical protein